MIEQREKITAFNPIILSDYPDPDVICVGDTFYMISTTMHCMPGAVILRSYNLVNWEIASYVYETLDGTKAQRLEENDIYGKGMWAATLRFHEGCFYVCFVANDTGNTYVYEADSIEGPWIKHTMDGFYHDSSLLFDDDGRVFIVYGSRQIYLTELSRDLTGPLKSGLHTMILEDSDEYRLGLEGSHLYKRNGKYYIFCIHWGERRTEACFMADCVEGPYLGQDVLDDDMDFRNMGVAQGGIVDTPDGDTYAMLFQDHGAMGRIPVLVPVHWKGDRPVFGVDGRVPKQLEVTDYRPGYQYAPLYESDDFNYVPDEQGQVKLKKAWQWNHEPDSENWSVTKRPGSLRLTTKDLRKNVVYAVNTLTQRVYGNYSEAEITLDGSLMKCGDYAGISAFMSEYCFLALNRTKSGFQILQLTPDTSTDLPERQMIGVATDNIVRLKISCTFNETEDFAESFYLSNQEWRRIGEPIPLHFTLDHFMGCRYALSYYSTLEAGGSVDFSNFVYLSRRRQSPTEIRIAEMCI